MIVLITDFGLKDPYVGIMKGIIKKISPQSEIIDLTHEIEPQDIHNASFFLNNSYQHFPPGSIFTVVVDPGVGSDRKPIVVQTQNYFFVGPDNGIFSFLNSINQIIHITEKKYFYLQQPSSTFHGKDIFAPVSAFLDLGIPIGNFGPPLKKIITHQFPKSSFEKNQIKVPLIHIDHFGNLIFNIHEQELSPYLKNQQIEILFKKIMINHIEDNYSSHKPFIALFNHYGLLEIAVPNGSAEKKLNIKKSSENWLLIKK